MPLFRYVCPAGHERELLRPRTVEVVSCACGETASRQAVYSVAVTGFTPVPREHKNYRREFSEFKEASAEVDYAYSRVEAGGQTVTPPNYFQEGLKKAAAQGAPVKGMINGGR